MKAMLVYEQDGHAMRRGEASNEPKKMINVLPAIIKVQIQKNVTDEQAGSTSLIGTMPKSLARKPLD